ncbi:MAG: dTDP-glucose 4,6-dehydratase [Clostridia bacterium]
MKVYLVTGGAGFIGSNYIKYIFEKYNEEVFVINVDKLTYAGNLENLKDVEKKENYAFEKVDICDKEGIEQIFIEYDIDYVVNFAAESHVDRSIKEPEVFVETNILGTQVLLNVAKKNWEENNKFISGKKFLQVSTDEVYGSLGLDGYFTEETPLNPHSPYSASKACADLLCKSFFDTYEMPINITRCSNNYGYYQFPEKLIPLIINIALYKKILPVFGDGMNIREWFYVKDHCKAIELVLRRGKLGEVYNIGGHNEKENIYIVRTIINTLSHLITDESICEKLITFVEDRKGHDRRYAIDAAKIRKELGWVPEVMFDNGIKETIKWYLENKEWLENVSGGEYQNYYTKMYG